MHAQDPRELFDIVSVDGVPTGQVKERALVHRDGDWHRAVHVWVAGIDEDGPFLLVQRRSLEKDTWPGCLDVTVGGHYRAGETLAEALREVEEEIGVPLPADELRLLGVRICINDAQPGIFDHELQDVFLWRRDDPLGCYRPNRHELSALLRIPLLPLLGVLAGEQLAVVAKSLSADDLTVKQVTIRQEEFRQRIDRYFFRCAIAVHHALRGERYVAV